MKKLTYLLFSVAILVFASCDNYLDRQSKTEMNDGNFWNSESNLRLFVNYAYPNYFVGYNSSWGTAYIPGVRGEISDDATKTGKQSNLLQAVPADNWYRAESSQPYWLQRTGAGPWNFAWIRKWNLMIERVNTMKENGALSDEAYNHWMGVARFFRAHEYSRFVQSFGDVPYQDAVVGSDDSDSQFLPRTDRGTVMTKVMEDLDFALANVRENDGTNYVNKYVVATLASRFMLFEGTWYLYHNGDQGLAKTFLNKAVEMAEFVMKSGKFEFDTDFRTLFGTIGKQTVGSEVILYRQYIAGQTTHCVASYANLTESQGAGANLSVLKSWICQDGQPYSKSTVENVESWRLQDMALTRDPRFEATFHDEPTAAGTGIYCIKFIDREGPTYSYDNAPARPAQYGSNTNTNGAPILRYAEVVLNWIEAKAELADKLGGAAVTQDDLDKSINAIRLRPLDETAIAKGVKQTAPLMLAALPDDPARTSTIEENTKGGVVSPLIWEIRRERRMEFFLEQTRILDIRRWGKLELMQGTTNPDILVGAWVDFNETKGLKKSFNQLTAAQFGNLKVRTNAEDPASIVTYDGTATDAGDITSDNAAAMVGFRIPTSITDREPIKERNYLEPVCTQVLDQYKEKGYSIEQNPGW